MTKRTSYFLFGSIGVLLIGLTAGLAAYYGGIRGIARQSGPGELALVPGDATVVAYADLRQLMASQFRQQIKGLGGPDRPEGQNELRDALGIDVEKDIDYVVGCLLPAGAAGGTSHSGYVLARGRFDRARIETYVRGKGGVEQHYKGRMVFVRAAGERSGMGAGERSGMGAGEHQGMGAGEHQGMGAGERPGMAETGHPARVDQSLAMTFIEPGVVALGTTESLHKAIDVAGGARAVTANPEMMKMVGGVESGNAWVVGRFDVLTSEAHLSNEIKRQLPQLTWFSATGHVDGGVSGSLSVQARDQEAAANLQQVIAGFIALVKMQAGSRPEIAALLQSVTLSADASDNTVSLSFSVPPAALEALKAAAASKGPIAK